MPTRGRARESRTVSGALAPGIGLTETSVNDTSAGRPKQFVVDLASAMRSTAESARQAAIEQCQSNAKAHTEHLRAQTNTETAHLRKAVANDVTIIRDQSKADMEKVRAETEQRISRRNELLEQELQEHNSAVELAIASVEQSIMAFEAELDRFFGQLLEGDYATIFATMASRMPDQPTFGEPDPTALVQELRRNGGQASPEVPEPDATSEAPEAPPDHWWLDSAADLVARTQATPEPGSPG